ncbi:MAG: hypothetical protein M3376_06025 [Actinomycetota bacterium]|nr:hypothetical protein [Actinomycetota bacterium]
MKLKPGDAFPSADGAAHLACGGAITVAREPVRWDSDPFARIFPGTVVRSDLFCTVKPPPGPVVERYARDAWPGGTFGDV